MTVDVALSVRIPLAKEPDPIVIERHERLPNAPSAPRQSRLRSIGKRVWHLLVVALSGPGLGEEFHGIDDAAMPSGFMAPYKRGSRGVRNLWHQPF